MDIFLYARRASMNPRPGLRYSRGKTDASPAGRNEKS